MVGSIGPTLSKSSRKKLKMGRLSLMNHWFFLEGPGIFFSQSGRKKAIEVGGWTDEAVT